LKEEYPMLSAEGALARVLSAFQPLPTERIPILETLGRVLTEDVIADMDIPPLANSAMDGYAVRAADTTGEARSACASSIIWPPATRPTRRSGREVPSVS
jgi:molybdopterin molybdotransferase